MVILQDFVEEVLSRKAMAKNAISGESGRNSVIEQDFGEKLLSCKILTEWTDILQDPVRNGCLENSDRKNDYRALICRKWLVC